MTEMTFETFCTVRDLLLAADERNIFLYSLAEVAKMCRLPLSVVREIERGLYTEYGL